MSHERLCCWSDAIDNERRLKRVVPEGSTSKNGAARFWQLFPGYRGCLPELSGVNGLALYAFNCILRIIFA
jgi:hypothetical protein